jgi:hypothetical protein
MKESQYLGYPGLIFRETFNDEQTCRANGGIPTDIDFRNGVGEFNGATSQIEYKDNTYNNFECATEFSIRLKFKHSMVTNNIELISKISGANWDYVLYTAAAGTQIRFARYDGSTLRAIDSINTINANDGEWHEVIFGRSTSNNLFMYIDGYASVETVDTTSNIDTGGAPLILGHLLSSYYEGFLDSVEIYKRELTVSEIANIDDDQWSIKPIFDGGLNADIPRTFVRHLGDPIINGDVIICPNNGNNNSVINTLYWEIGKSYLINASLTNYSGSSTILLPYDGISAGMQLTANGVHLYIYTPTTTSMFVFCRTTNGGTITVHSIQEINPKTIMEFDSTNGVIEDITVRSTISNNLVNNGDFANWTTDDPDGWSISNETIDNYVTEDYNGLKYVFTTGAAVTFTQPAIFTIGKTYRIIVDLHSVASGGFQCQGGSASTAAFYSAGVHTYELTASQTYLICARATDNSEFIIRNLTVYEISPSLDISDEIKVVETGSNYSAEFDGNAGAVDTGIDIIDTKAITAMVWIKPYSTGGSGYGRILDNGKFVCYLVDNRICTSSDNTTLVYFATNSIKWHKWQFIVITREIDGTVNFYIGDQENPPTLSGASNQNSGTPATGTSNLIIGNDVADSRAFHGLIQKIPIIHGIIAEQIITQQWSSTIKDLN